MMSNYVYYSELYHHGILGQTWGKKNGPPYPLDPKDRSAKEKRLAAKYTNVDGSLNEKGKDYRDRYTYKKISQNDKYYERYKAKYQKKADKALEKGNKEEHDRWISKKESAEQSRVSVNENILKMPISDIIRDAREQRSKNIKKGIGIAVGVVAAGMGAAGVARAMITGETIGSSIAKVFSNVSYDSIRKAALRISASPVGVKVKEAVDTALRLYADARGYVTSTVLSQTLYNLKESGALDGIKDTVSGALQNASGNTVSTVANFAKSAEIGKAYMQIKQVTG